MLTVRAQIVSAQLAELAVLAVYTSLDRNTVPHLQIFYALADSDNLAG